MYFFRKYFEKIRKKYKGERGEGYKILPRREPKKK